MSDLRQTSTDLPVRPSTRLLSTAEAAVIAGTSQGTIQAALRDGKLRGARLGGTGHWRIHERDVWRWASWIEPATDLDSFASSSEPTLSPSDLGMGDGAAEEGLMILEGDPERWVPFDEGT